MPPKLKLTPDTYDKLDKTVGRVGTEFYSVVAHKFRGLWVRSIHVFARQPLPKEMVRFENDLSKLRMRANRTDVDGSQTAAANHLYNALIQRAYDVPSGFEILGEVKTDKDGVLISGQPLSREEAIERVPVMIKRTAVRDFGEHYSEAQVSDMEGDDEVKGEEDDD